MADEQTDTAAVETPIEQASPEATTDDGMDAILDQMLDEPGADKPEEAVAESKEERPRDEKGQYAKKDTSEDESPKDNEPASADIEPKGYQAALAALTRDGVPDSVLESMKPDEIVAWGGKRERVQKDVDGYAARIQELEQKPTEEATEREAAPAEPLDLKAVVEPLVAEYGEEMGPHMQAFGETLVNHLTKQLTERLSAQADEQSNRVNFLSNVASELFESKTRNDLGERFDQVKDDATWATVRESATTLWKTGRYDSLTEAFKAAARLELSTDEMMAEQKKLKATVNRMKKSGQPETQSRAAKSSPKQASGEEEWDTVLDKILDD